MTKAALDVRKHAHLSPPVSGMLPYRVRLNRTLRVNRLSAPIDPELDVDPPPLAYKA